MGENKRPFGVGLLVIGHDELGPHLYQTSPNAEYFEYFVFIFFITYSNITFPPQAYAIGAKSQPAKTYLEKNYKAFLNCNLFSHVPSVETHF